MLVEVFGDYPQIRVMEYLLANPFNKHTKQQIAVGSEISRITLNKFIDDILDNNILIKDQSSRFSLNLKSPIVQILNKTLDALNKIEMEKQMKNLDEPYDILSDEELDIIFDENASDVNLDDLEREISLREMTLVTLEYKENNENNFKLAFANNF